MNVQEFYMHKLMIFISLCYKESGRGCIYLVERYYHIVNFSIVQRHTKNVLYSAQFIDLQTQWPVIHWNTCLHSTQYITNPVINLRFKQPGGSFCLRQLINSIRACSQYLLPNIHILPVYIPLYSNTYTHTYRIVLRVSIIRTSSHWLAQVTLRKYERPHTITRII